MKVTVLSSLNAGLLSAMQRDERVYLLGEDILDPYGGAFKVTKDLSLRYPGRVCNTPISEGAITGAGGGLALAGAPAVVEIMFGDFLTLTFDQLYQHAAKFPGDARHAVHDARPCILPDRARPVLEHFR